MPEMVGGRRSCRIVCEKRLRYLYPYLGANGNNRHAQDQCWSVLISLLRGRWHYQHVSTVEQSMAVNCNLVVQGDDGIVVTFHDLGCQWQSIMISLFKGIILLQERFNIRALNEFPIVVSLSRVLALWKCFNTPIVQCWSVGCQATVAAVRAQQLMETSHSKLQVPGPI